AHLYYFFFFSSRRRHTRSKRDWSSDVCSSDLGEGVRAQRGQLFTSGIGLSQQLFRLLIVLFRTAHIERLDLWVLVQCRFDGVLRSEERRVGKEWRSGQGHYRAEARDKPE